VQDDLGAELGEQRIGDVFGVEVGGGVADEGDEVGAVGVVGAGVESLSGCA
jgi:hypothetical protein